jgi:predicted secreted protein
MSERAGKDLILKIKSTLEIDVLVGTGDVPSNLLATAHGKSVGDVVYFDTVPGTVSEVQVNTPYYIKEVADNSFKISATVDGAAITFAASITNLNISVYSTVGGLRTSSLSFGSDAIDGTNYGSNQWRKIIEDAGIRRMDVSGDGVFTDDQNFEDLQDSAMDNEHVDLVWIDVKTGMLFKGEFKIPSFELGASYDAEGTFSMSAESSGPVSVKRV